MYLDNLETKLSMLVLNDNVKNWIFISDLFLFPLVSECDFKLQIQPTNQPTPIILKVCFCL